MTNEEKPKKRPVDEATLKRLAEGRLKGLEIRRKRAELKKQEKAEQREKINKEYEEKVLKKQETKAEPTKDEEYDKEIYNNTNTDNGGNTSDDEESEQEEVVKTPMKTPRKPKAVIQDTTPNYKQEYYKHKLSLLQQQREQSQFMDNYTRLPPQHHLADIAKNQIKQRVDSEVMSRVYKELFGM